MLRSSSISIASCAVACFGLSWSTFGMTALAAPPNAELPLNRIVLYSSGVGFFERSGEIDGDKQVELKFNLEDVNDILKSMILRDLGDGKITHVTYDSPEPVTRTLQTFSIDLARNPSLSDLLKQIRGEKVQVMSPNPTTGVIVGIERKKQAAGKDQQLVDVDTLLLKTETGLRGIPMANITETKILNERLDKELQDALGILAQAHATNKKTVTLNFQGKGKRPVVVGYIQEAPVWKTTYRLALDDKGTHLLQGWAIVENTTEQDWQDVKVTLVSGRPVSFQMDLYQPLFADRPVVVPELFANLQPRVHDQDLSGGGGKMPANPFSLGGGLGGQGAFGGGLGGGGLGGGGAFVGGGVPITTDTTQRPFAAGVVPVIDQPLDLKKGITSVAQAGEVGELFRYKIDLPVSLAREKAALLPIVNDPVKGTKLSLFNAEVHPKHPMNALKLVNDTKFHLMQGPITVFDGGEYAGDAQIEALAPGGERLITYALDLDVEVATEGNKSRETITEVYIAKGVLHAKKASVRRQIFTIKNSGDKPKKVYLEIPLDAAWELREQKKPTEKTRALYRFAVDAPPGKSTKFHVVEGRDEWERVALAEFKADALELWIESTVRGNPTGDARLLAAGPAVRAAITEMRKRQTAIDDVAAKRKSLESDISEIKDEQARIRQNMGQLDHTSDLFRRYEKTFGEQEDKLNKLRPELKSVAAEEARQKKALGEYINELDVKEKVVKDEDARDKDAKEKDKQK